jgi:hypothetical protein
MGLRALAATVVAFVVAAVVASSAAGASGPWIPSAAAPIPWQWELAHPLNLLSPSDMGTNGVLYTGPLAPTPQVYDIDGIENPASTVTALHAKGKHVICYIEVGAAGNYGGVYSTYYSQLSKAGDLGPKMPGYHEKYLKIGNSTTATIVKQIIHDQCAAKGFDAVEPDIDDEWYDGVGITMATEESYLHTLSTYAHSLGLSWGLKDGDQANNTSDSAKFVSDLVAQHTIDWALTEQSFQYGADSALYPTLQNAGLAWFEAEYNDQGGPSPTSYCATAHAENANAVQYDSNLDGAVRVACS